MSETETTKENIVQMFSPEKTYIVGIPKKGAFRKNAEFSASRIFLGIDLLKDYKAESIHDLKKNKKFGFNPKKQYWVCEIKDTRLQYMGEFQPDAPAPVKPKAKGNNGIARVYVSQGMNDDVSEQHNGAFIPPTMLANFGEANAKNYTMQIKLLQEQLQSERTQHQHIIDDKNRDIERLSASHEDALNRQQLLFEETLSYERAQQDQIRNSYLKLQNDYLVLQNKISTVSAEKDIIIQRARDKDKLQKDVMETQQKINAERQKWAEKYSQQQEGLGDGVGNILTDIMKMFGPVIVGAMTGGNNNNNNTVVQTPPQQNFSMGGTADNSQKPQPKIPPIITPMQPPVRTEGNVA